MRGHYQANRWNNSKNILNWTRLKRVGILYLFIFFNCLDNIQMFFSNHNWLSIMQRVSFRPCFYLKFMFYQISYILKMAVWTIYTPRHVYKLFLSQIRPVFKCLQVAVYWMHYVEKIDDLVSQALILNYRCSLENLLRLSVGDGSGPVPAVLIRVSLDGNKVTEINKGNKGKGKTRSDQTRNHIR